MYLAGIGCLTVPLVSTQFAQRQRWSFHYFTSLGLAIVNSTLAGTVYQLRDEESESSTALRSTSI